MISDSLKIQIELKIKAPNHFLRNTIKLSPLNAKLFITKNLDEIKILKLLISKERI